MKNKMFFINILFCLLITSCIPGFAFFIENNSGESIELVFSICDDFLNDEFLNNGYLKKDTQKRLENGESCEIRIIPSKLFNRGLAHEEYQYTETYLSIFENITIKFLDSNIMITKMDLSQYKIRIVKRIPPARDIILIITEVLQDTHERQAPKSS